MDHLQLTIDSVAFGGKGVARLDGKVWFVTDALPGDEVKARIVSDSGRYGDAAVVEILRPSPLRGAPRCRFAHECGGCQWMGVPYLHQVEWKKQFVKTALRRIGRLFDDFDFAILPSPNEYSYRNRVLLRLHVTEAGTVEIGYFKRQSRDLVPITRCEIAAEPINRFIAAVRALDLHDLQGLKARLEVQETDTSKAHATNEAPLVVTVFPGDGRSPEVEALAARLSQLPHVVWAGLVFDLPQAPVVMLDEDLGIRFLTIPGQFQQVNVPHNHRLRRLVKDHVEALDRTAGYQARVLDIFCGSGNLSLPLADGRRYVEGIESNKKAIAVAKKNVEANLLTNCNYIAGDAEAHLWKVSKKNECFDLVILDPPRTGMYQGMIPLRNLAAKHIVYVSCDPTTLARDLGALTKGERYRVDRLVALDFFPHTFHVESVAFLSQQG